jgi:hypothetical protein
MVAVNYGTLPDWLAAIGTVGALAFALVLFARDQEDRRRAQARRVVCWLVVEPTTSSFRPGIEGPTTTSIVGDHLEALLHNGSEEPVFDCRVQVDLDPRQASTAGPDSNWRLVLTERMLPPGRTPRPLWELPGRDLPHANVWMVFTDANNQRWQRSHTGRLSRLVDVAERASPSTRVGCGVRWNGRRR